MPVGRDLPQLLHPDAELLRLSAVAQVVAGHDGLGERAADALGDEDVFAVQLEAGLEVAGAGALERFVLARKPGGREKRVLDKLGYNSWKGSASVRK